MYLTMCLKKIWLVLDNATLSIYLRNGSVEDARQLCDKIYERNVKSWTSMIMGYAHNMHGEEALNMFFEMSVGRHEA
jgi:pentatricopeptide repeat protein